MAKVDNSVPLWQRVLSQNVEAFQNDLQDCSDLDLVVTKLQQLSDAATLVRLMKQQGEKKVSISSSKKRKETSSGLEPLNEKRRQILDGNSYKADFPIPTNVREMLIKTEFATPSDLGKLLFLTNKRACNGLVIEKDDLFRLWYERSGVRKPNCITEKDDIWFFKQLHNKIRYQKSRDDKMVLFDAIRLAQKDIQWEDLVMVITVWNGGKLLTSAEIEGLPLGSTMSEGRDFEPDGEDPHIIINRTKSLRIHAVLFRLDTNQSCCLVDECFDLTGHQNQVMFRARSEFPLAMNRDWESSLQDFNIKKSGFSKGFRPTVSLETKEVASSEGSQTVVSHLKYHQTHGTDVMDLFYDEENFPLLRILQNLKGWE